MFAVDQSAKKPAGSANQTFIRHAALVVSGARVRSCRANQKGPVRLGQLPRTTFEVSLPIEDALEPNFQNAVEGVRRLGSIRNPTGIQAVDFGGGSVTAVFELMPTGEPSLIPLFPTGVR